MDYQMGHQAQTGQPAWALLEKVAAWSLLQPVLICVISALQSLRVSSYLPPEFLAANDAGEDFQILTSPKRKFLCV